MAHRFLLPFAVAPRAVEAIWGGQRLRSLLGRDLSHDRPIGETWEVYDENEVADGPLAGRALAELARVEPKTLLGSRAAALRGAGQAFPLLLKFIDANTTLSIQVHPDDAYAGAHEAGRAGKTEAYYVLEAAPSARLYYGLRAAVDRAALGRAVQDGTLEELVAWREVKPGDVFYTPPGTVHALGAGLVVYEIQQCSTITYRLYDWGRVGADGRPRQLHVAQSLAVVRFPQPVAQPIQPLVVPDHAGQRKLLAAGRYFALESLEQPGGSQLDGSTFHLLTSLGGPATIVGDRFGELPIAHGATLIVPASGGDYQYTPPADGRLLRAYVPDLARDVVAPLRAAGHADETIQQLGEVF